MLDQGVDREARKKEQNRASYARRLERLAQESAAREASPRLTANPAHATTIRLQSGKRIKPCEVPSWKF
jgi:hypothetical protein